MFQASFIAVIHAITEKSFPCSFESNTVKVVGETSKYAKVQINHEET